LKAPIIYPGAALTVRALSLNERIIYQHEFFDLLDDKSKKKLVIRIRQLGDIPPPIKNDEVSRKISQNLFELRAKSQKRYLRLFYFYDGEKQAIITHGFSKKSDKTPKREIEHAEQLRDRFLTITE
jgi:phage-related protein